MSNGIKLVCPECKGDLIYKAEDLICQQCSAVSGKMINNIPSFVKEDFYWGEIPQEEMIKINEMVPQKGWRVALEFIRSEYPVFYDSLLDSDKTDWRFFFPLTSQSTILDVGSGWGGLSFLLAPIVKRIISLEVVKERVEFINIRKNHENIQNIHPVKANILNPPLPNSYFDLIIMNGVLEWVGISDEKRNPLEVQKNVLNNIFNILKKDGYLYIGIENRYGYNLIMGSIDHSGLKFTSLLPRRIADIYIRIMKKEYYRTTKASYSYRTYTHSYYAYINLLKEVGFSDIKIYGVFPGYHTPKYIIPLYNKKVCRYFLDNIYLSSTLKGNILKVLTKIGIFFNLHKLFFPEFCIIAKKVDKKESE